MEELRDDLGEGGHDITVFSGVLSTFSFFSLPFSDSTSPFHIYNLSTFLIPTFCGPLGLLYLHSSCSRASLERRISTCSTFFFFCLVLSAQAASFPVGLGLCFVVSMDVCIAFVDLWEVGGMVACARAGKTSDQLTTWYGELWIKCTLGQKFECEMWSRAILCNSFLFRFLPTQPVIIVQISKYLPVS
jgi:hypothetical protein